MSDVPENRASGAACGNCPAIRSECDTLRVSWRARTRALNRRGAAAAHSQTWPSASPAASVFPSRLKATLKAPSRLVRNAAPEGAYVAMSHTRTCPSAVAVASVRPAGSKATEYTALLPARMTRPTGRRLFRFHSRTTPSTSPTASIRPSGLSATASADPHHHGGCPPHPARPRSRAPRSCCCARSSGPRARTGRPLVPTGRAEEKHGVACRGSALHQRPARVTSREWLRGARGCEMTAPTGPGR